MIFLVAILPILIGFLLDAVLGDPYNMPHPIRLIGKLISSLENRIRSNQRLTARKGGALLSIIVLVISTITPLLFLCFFYWINTWLGIIFEGIMCYYLLAAKCLKLESMKVYNCLKNNDIEGARYAVSMIVGRDTKSLDTTGITKAAVETVAENTSDGVTAPMLYIAIGGAALGFFYKASNTMDSMIGYKNEKYIEFGRFAAKLDDILNFIPSRLTALFMILSAHCIGFDGKEAYRIWKRDRLNHASPNSAQTEAVCAGALNIQLAGDAYYFGKLCRKKTIGDDTRPTEAEDIKHTNKLMYCTSLITLCVAIVIRCLLLEGVV